MKTLVKYSIAVTLLTFVLNVNAITPPTIAALPEEAYIDDIPFNTGHIFDSLVDVSLTKTYQLTDESYIRDIPFNTAEIASENLDATSFDLEEESYINDIPFSTELYAKQ